MNPDKTIKFLERDDKQQTWEDFFKIRNAPVSTLVSLYEARLAHAESNLKYWTNEYASHGDVVSEAAWRAAEKTVGDVWNILDRIKTPQTL